MMKKLMIGVAAGALMVSGALAQSPNPTPSPSAPAPAAAPSAQAPESKAPEAKPDQQAAKPDQKNGGKLDFVASQKPDQWLASKFKGTDVIGSDDKKIGDVSDILFDKNGKIEAFVVSVGGFLGMGAKDVALAPSSFDVVPGTNGDYDKLRLTLTQEELKQAQNFVAYQPPRPTTTGSGSPMGTPGAMRPASNPPPTGR